MKCPACEMDLAMGEKSGHQVLRCGRCKGLLIPNWRYDLMRRLDRPTSEVQAEARAELGRDTKDPARCPRCRERMEKQAVKLPRLDVLVDRCRRCALVWLDGGELALVQLAARNTPQHAQAMELKRRAVARDSDPERKARFEEAVSRMPELRTPMDEAWDEMLERSDDWLIDGLLDAMEPGP